VVLVRAANAVVLPLTCWCRLMSLYFQHAEQVVSLDGKLETQLHIRSFILTNPGAYVGCGGGGCGGGGCGGGGGGCGG
jgi:hypothetical protein